MYKNAVGPKPPRDPWKGLNADPKSDAGGTRPPWNVIGW